MNITDILSYFYRSNNQSSNQVPLTFTTVGGMSTVKLIQLVGTYNCKFYYRKFYIDLNKQPVLTDWLSYTIGLLIRLNKVGLYVSFYNSDSILNKVTASGSPVNVYKFVTNGGTIDCTGSINSMTNYKLLMKLAGTFYQLFANCKNLRSPCSLPSKRLSMFCYGRLFSGCTGLIIPPQLPALTVGVYSYFRMFNGCTKLSVPPLLPGKVLGSQCYAGMFIGCTSLNKTPYLGHLTIPTQGYFQMFTNCSKLSNVYINAKLWNGNGTSTWLNNVSPSGIFYKNDLLPLSTGINYIPSSWSIEPLYQLLKLWLPLTFKNIDTKATTIKLSANGTPHTVDIRYKLLNNRWWKRYNIGLVVSINPGLTIKFKNNLGVLSKSNTDFYKFELTGKWLSYGDTTSLINYQLLTTYCFYKLFNGCATLYSSPSLPSLKLAEYCYRNMFDSCTNLVTPPRLPGMVLATGCYYQMFKSCKNMLTFPLLPATLLANTCYYGMLAYCSKVTLGPALPATTLANSCYKFMFEGCIAMTTVPMLPAKNLVDNCYGYMFYGCTKLTNIPELVFKKLASKSCEYMFYNCKSLNLISVEFKLWSPTNATTNWVHGVSQNGTFIKPERLLTIFGVNNIPTNWYVLLVPLLICLIYDLSEQLLTICGNGYIDPNDLELLVVESEVIKNDFN